jgi:MinD-like ATPase involved in chromosome partitioning or flagellar assembly
LGRIPLDVRNRIAGDEGKPVVLHDPESGTSQAFQRIAKKVVDLLK